MGSDEQGLESGVDDQHAKHYLHRNHDSGNYGSVARRLRVPNSKYCCGIDQSGSNDYHQPVIMLKEIFL